MLTSRASRFSAWKTHTSLLGLPPPEKYRPSTEQVLNATKPYIGAANWRREAEQIGWLLIANT